MLSTRPSATEHFGERDREEETRKTQGRDRWETGRRGEEKEREKEGTTSQRLK